MNISLPDGVLAYLDERIAQGEATTRNELVREALRLALRLRDLGEPPLTELLAHAVARLEDATPSELQRSRQSIQELRAALPTLPAGAVRIDD